LNIYDIWNNTLLLTPIMSLLTEARCLITVNGEKLRYQVVFGTLWTFWSTLWRCLVAHGHTVLSNQCYFNTLPMNFDRFAAL